MYSIHQGANKVNGAKESDSKAQLEDIIYSRVYLWRPETKREEIVYQYKRLWDGFYDRVLRVIGRQTSPHAFWEEPERKLLGYSSTATAERNEISDRHPCEPSFSASRDDRALAVHWHLRSRLGHRLGPAAGSARP
jgi:hypothetical protein